MIKNAPTLHLFRSHEAMEDMKGSVMKSIPPRAKIGSDISSGKADIIKNT